MKESEEQQARRRRAANRLSGLEIICAGLALPFLYLIYTLMFFSDPDQIALTIIVACSILCVITGIWVFIKS
jgi:high-affinity K+ transport system ATPase subunit B